MKKEKGSHAENAKTAKKYLSDLSVKMKRNTHAENAKTAKKKLGELSVK